MLVKNCLLNSSEEIEIERAGERIVVAFVSIAVVAVVGSVKRAARLSSNEHFDLS